MASLYSPTPFTQRVVLEIGFLFPTEPTCDKDNGAGGIMDALQPQSQLERAMREALEGVLWYDDKQILDLRCYWDPSWEKVILIRAKEVPQPKAPPKPKAPRKRNGAA
jgi:hypothetical protein